jgi:hypothetical protein
MSVQYFNFLSQTDKFKEVRMVRIDSRPIRWVAILGCSVVFAALGLTHQVSQRCDEGKENV